MFYDTRPDTTILIKTKITEELNGRAGPALRSSDDSPDPEKLGVSTYRALTLRLVLAIAPAVRYLGEL